MPASDREPDYMFGRFDRASEDWMRVLPLAPPSDEADVAAHTPRDPDAEALPSDQGG